MFSETEWRIFVRLAAGPDSELERCCKDGELGSDISFASEAKTFELCFLALKLFITAIKIILTFYVLIIPKNKIMTAYPETTVEWQICRRTCFCHCSQSFFALRTRRQNHLKKSQCGRMLLFIILTWERMFLTKSTSHLSEALLVSVEKGSRTDGCFFNFSVRQILIDWIHIWLLFQPYKTNSS